MFKNNSSQIAALISPVHGCRDELRRQGKNPKNHHRDNISYIKSLSKIKTLKKPPVQKRSVSISGKNFIETNIKGIKDYQASPPNDSLTESFSLGQVPEYLSTIKAMLNETKAEQAYESSKQTWPEGTRLLKDSEKQEFLSKLLQEKQELTAKLNSLPFTSDTNATKSRRSACETRLKQVEFEIARFSVPRVFYPA